MYGAASSTVDEDPPTLPPFEVPGFPPDYDPVPLPDPYPEDPYPDDGDTGGDGGGGSEPIPEEPNPACPILEQAARDAGCDLRNPPRLEVNGCGTTDFDAPDYLLARPWLGEIFTGACDSHDTCYGTFGTNKESCDLRLGNQMRQACSSSAFTLGMTDFPFHACDEQANIYSGVLQSSLVTFFISGPAFDRAQHEGQCRMLAEEAQAEDCP